MMCSRMLRHKPESEQGWFYRTSEHAFRSIINFYGRTLRWVLRHQTATLVVAVGTLAMTVWLYILFPRLLPRAGYRGHSGHFRGAANRLLRAMAERQQELAKVIMQDPRSKVYRRSSASTARTRR